MTAKCRIDIDNDVETGQSDDGMKTFRETGTGRIKLNASGRWNKDIWIERSEEKRDGEDVLIMKFAVVMRHDKGKVPGGPKA